jgi:hypothetical protein
MEGRPPQEKQGGGDEQTNDAVIGKHFFMPSF